MADQIQIQIQLDDGSVKQGFINIEKQAKSSAANTENYLSDAFGSISDKIKGIGLTIAAAFTVNKLVNFLEDSAKKAGEAERATNALASSLANINQYSRDAVNGFSEFAGQLQRQTGIEDDLIKQNAALLVSIGGLSGKGLERATLASLNLARALQIDVGTAFDIVAKASTGNLIPLTRYGIRIDDNLKRSEKFAAVLKLVETRFSGLAATNLNTFDGSLQNLSNSFGELQESIGGLITNSPALRAVINTIASELFSFADSLSKKFAGKDFFGSLILTVIELGGVLNEYFVKPLELGFNLLQLGIGGVKLALDALVVGVTGFGKLLAEAFVFPLRDLANAAGSIIGVVNKDLGGKLSAAANSLAVQFTQPFQAEFLNSKLILEETFNDLTSLADKAFNSKLGGSIESFLAKLKKSVESAKAITNDFRNNTEINTKQLSEAWIAAEKSIAQSIQQGISKTVVTSLQTIGASLVKGASAFSNFREIIIGILGDLAIQVGTILIGIGLGLENLKVGLATFNGAAVAVAGAALIVLGGALKALAGGAGGAATAPATGGGVAASPSPTTELTPTQNLTRQEPQTAVSVVIQGDVLDSDESGSRIVSLINDAFSKKGVVIQQGVMA